MLVLAAPLLLCGHGFAQTGQNQPPRPAHSALSDPLAPPRPDPLRVAHDEALWPFSFREKGGYTGFELELWAKVAEGMGVEYELFPMPFADILPALENGDIDVAIAAIPVTQARQERVLFSLPYFRTGLAALCREDSLGEDAPVPEEPKDKGKSKNTGKNAGKDTGKDKFEMFRGHSLAVQRGSAGESFARKNLTDSELKDYAFQEEMFFELLARNVDIVFAELNLLEAYLNVTKNPALSVCSPVYDAHNLAIALPKASVHQKELNRSLQAFRNSDEFKALCEKWFGVVPKFGK